MRKQQFAHAPVYCRIASAQHKLPQCGDLPACCYQPNTPCALQLICAKHSAVNARWQACVAIRACGTAHTGLQCAARTPATIKNIAQKHRPKTWPSGPCPQPALNGLQPRLACRQYCPPQDESARLVPTHSHKPAPLYQPAKQPIHAPCAFKSGKSCQLQVREQQADTKVQASNTPIKVSSITCCAAARLTSHVHCIIQQIEHANIITYKNYKQSFS